ncbi:MAG: hypothetical protein FWE33_00470 [Defluviitaleaceae bacterium]|nr:hypothetical protein [Defluviitaleaceae bacterium]
MIDFKSELKKFKPVLEVDNIEEDVVDCDAKDVMELLQYLFAQKNETRAN